MKDNLIAQLRDAHSFMGDPLLKEAADALAAQAARVDLDAMLREQFRRRAPVEEALQQIAAGKRRDLTQKEAAEFAALIGVPDEYRVAPAVPDVKAQDDLNAGRELMRQAWHQLNAIRAWRGSPPGVSEDWFSNMVDELKGLLRDDCVPWMTGAAKVLVEPYRKELVEAQDRILALSAQAARAEAAEYRAEAMERSLCDADARLGNLLARVHRDGGHYQDQHGTEKACADADLIVSDLLAAQDRVEATERALQSALKALDRVTEPAKRFSAEKDQYAITVTLGAMRKARAALSQKGGEHG